MIALITPTGARPAQIKHCAKFMQRQDYKGAVLWVIIDDALPITTDFITEDFKENWTILKLYPETPWKPGQNTQARNLNAGVSVLEAWGIEAVFIVEDDDYYRPDYLRIMAEKLKDNDLVGEKNTIYYHVPAECWMQNGNETHASLFQVAFKPQLIGIFKNACRAGSKFIDIRFFKEARKAGARIHLFNSTHLSVGIKGLPGRTGIGMGHRIAGRMIPDPGKERLKELLKEDYIHYN